MIVLLLTPFVRAQNDPKKDKPKTAQEQFDALIGELEKARGEADKEIRAAKAKDEKQKIQDEFMKKLQAMTPRMLELAEKNPKETVSGEALLFVISLAPPGAQQDKAISLLLKNQGDRVPDACMMLAQAGNPQAQAFFKAVLDQKDTSNKAKAFATLGMASIAQRKSRWQSQTLPTPPSFQGSGRSVRRDSQEVQGRQRSRRGRRSGIVRAEEPVDRQGCSRYRGHRQRRQQFKLSDYRGKVVVLDFWALVVRALHGLVPHEIKLVKRLEGKPSPWWASISAQREELKKGEKKWHHLAIIPRRQTRPHRRKAESPGSRTYVLDAKGVIRYKDVRRRRWTTPSTPCSKMGATAKN